MNHPTFNALLKETTELMYSVLASKSQEYSTDDKLHNFKEAGKAFDSKPTVVCWSYMMKYLVSIKDIAYGKPVSIEAINEKIGDALNYLVLMKALLLEQTYQPRSTETRPRIVCLCGSTKFYQTYQVAHYQETMKGNIVLSVGYYPHGEKHNETVGCTEAEKVRTR